MEFRDRLGERKENPSAAPSIYLFYAGNRPQSRHCEVTFTFLYIDSNLRKDKHLFNVYKDVIKSHIPTESDCFLKRN